jgi:hypothetical protein
MLDEMQREGELDAGLDLDEDDMTQAQLLAALHQEAPMQGLDDDDFMDYA